MKTIFRTKTIKALAMCAVLLSGSTNLFAQGPRVLSLDEAIELSIQNSKQLKLGQSNVDIAGLEIRQIRDSQLPSLGVSASYLRLNTPDITMKSSRSEGDSSASGGGFGKVHQAMYGMVNASVPIFTGFRFKYGLESAKYLEQAARLDVENDRMAIIQNTVAAYGNLYKSQKAVDLVSEQLKSEQKRVAEFTNREKNGMLARNDLMKAKLQASNVELALLDAENELKLTTVNMNLLLGLPEETPLAVDATGFALQQEGTLSQWEEKAMINRKDLAANVIRQKAASANIKVAKADLYPNVALTGGYVALSLPGMVTIPNAMNIGVGVKYDIASLWKSGAKIAEARTREFQVKTNQEMLFDKVHMEINTAYYNYVLSKRRIEVLATAVEQADENFRITKNKYENSLVSTTDLLDADVDQIRSKINFESAKADAVVAFKKLQQVSGVLN